MRTIIIAGVNGCFVELKQLLKKCNYVQEDTLVFLGNVANDGPEPYHTLNFIYHLTHNNFVIIEGEFEKSLKCEDDPIECYILPRLQKILEKFPSTTIGLFHLDNLRNSFDGFELQNCVMFADTEHMEKGLQKYDMKKPVILGENYKDNTGVNKPVYTIKNGRKSIYLNTNCINGGKLTALLVESS